MMTAGLGIIGQLARVPSKNGNRRRHRVSASLAGSVRLRRCSASRRPRGILIFLVSRARVRLKKLSGRYRTRWGPASASQRLRRSTSSRARALLPPNTKRWVVGRRAAVRSAVRSHHYRAGLPSLRAFRGEDPVMAARSKPMAFRGCAPLAFRLTVADPNYQRSIWSSRTTRSWPSVSLLMRY